MRGERAGRALEGKVTAGHFDSEKFIFHSLKESGELGEAAKDELEALRARITEAVEAAVPEVEDGLVVGQNCTLREPLSHQHIFRHIIFL